MDIDLRYSLSSTIFLFMGRQEAQRLKGYAAGLQRSEQVIDYDILCDITGVPPELQEAFEHFQIIQNRILASDGSN